METTNAFESWYRIIKENELAAIDAPVKSQSPEIFKEVDDIISSLEVLAKELTEELNAIPDNEIYEGESSSVVDYMIRAPRARKAQAKVNTINTKVADLEAAHSVAPKETKAKLKDKITLMRSQASDLQKAVDDKFSKSSSIVQGAKSSEKIKGRLEVIKTAMGDKTNDPSDLKQQAAKLQQRLKDEEAALADSKPEESEVEKFKKQKEEEALKKKEKESKETSSNKKGETETTSNNKKGETETTSDNKKGETETTSDNKEGETETKNPKIKKLEDEIADLEKKLKDSEKDNPNPDKKAKDGRQLLQNIIDSKKSSLQSLKDKTQESLIIRANAVGLNELAKEIESKLHWQVAEGTALYTKYENLIKKSEYTNTLNESRYQNLSVKERFSRLM